jgi:hypothetical protein
MKTSSIFLIAILSICSFLVGYQIGHTEGEHKETIKWTKVVDSINLKVENTTLKIEKDRIIQQKIDSVQFLNKMTAYRIGYVAGGITMRGLCDEKRENITMLFMDQLKRDSTKDSTEMAHL